MSRKFTCVLLVFVTQCGCSGQYVRHTYTISPAAEDDLRRLHEAIRGNDLQLRKVNEEPTAVEDLRVTSDSTAYLVRMPWICGVRPYDSLTHHTVPTPDIISVSICSVKHTTSYAALGAVAGGVLSTVFAYKYVSALSDALGENDDDPSFKLKDLPATFLPGAILGAVIGLYVGETEAVWDMYRFDHGGS